MPITELIHRFDPPAPPAVMHAAKHLHYRAFILVALIVNRARVFPDHWIYIHSPEARVGRIQNFKNWSAAMVPDPQKSSLGLEYFDDEGDALWNRDDAELIALAQDELQTLGLAHEAEIEEGFVIRQPKAYPAYDAGYREHLRVLREFLSSFENL
jgi:protoporphyrinogen oxidase